MIMSRKVSLYPKLIRFHKNIRIASNVLFFTHDGKRKLLGKVFPDKRYTEKNWLY
ncbi:hypothetical protein M670_03637 [Schinkia azotoformans MEV2011]|uniref:Uncharacterized protein n=1 Tax=Schinkia azotoformans MEV2011 TaxID=1348973 RepID=A0A072NVF0_SCHAZ|nr:hypothetical protein M670_03637 [Schinkia azotoformans MEV2011]